MKRILQIGLVTLVICVCLLGSFALGTFLYVRYGGTPSRLAEIESRTERLERQKPWTTRTWVERIASEGTTNEWRVLRLTNNLPEVQKFHSWPDKQSSGTKAIAAWLTDWTPRSEILKFEQFRVLGYQDTVLIMAKPRTNESISMEIWITAIFE